MTTMNGAALMVAAAEQVMFEARHAEGAASAEAFMVYALPSPAAKDALPLIERFRHAAEVKREEVALVQTQVLQHQQDVEDKKEQEEEREHRELMEYHEAMQGLLKETERETNELDQTIQKDQRKHDDEDAIYADGREIVRSKDGKHWLHLDGVEVTDEEQIEVGNAQEKALEARGGHAETIDEHYEREAVRHEAQKTSEEAKQVSAKNTSSEPQTEEERQARLTEQRNIIEKEKKEQNRLNNFDKVGNTKTHEEDLSGFSDSNSEVPIAKTQSSFSSSFKDAVTGDPVIEASPANQSKSQMPASKVFAPI